MVLHKFFIGLCIGVLSVSVIALSHITVLAQNDDTTQTEDTDTDDSQETVSDTEESADESDTDSSDSATESEEQGTTDDETEESSEVTTQEDEEVSDEIEAIKEKVASKVEELADSQFAVAGFIKEITDDKITVETNKGQKDILVDQEITEFLEITGKTTDEYDFEDFKTNDYIVATGPQIDGVTNANTVYLDQHYTTRSGKIVEVNEDDFYIRVLSLDKTDMTVDIEEETDTSLLNIKDMETEGIGFSKLKVGDIVHFSARKGFRKVQERFSATDMLVIPQEYFEK